MHNVSQIIETEDSIITCALLTPDYALQKSILHFVYQDFYSHI